MYKKYKNRHSNSGRRIEHTNSSRTRSPTPDPVGEQRQQSDSDDELAKYKAKVRELEAKMSTRKNKKKPTGMDDNVQKAVKTGLSNTVMRTICFVSDEEQEHTLARAMAIASLRPEFQANCPEQEANLNAFVKDFSGTCVAMLNEHRSQLSHKLKKICNNYWLKHKDMPDLDKLKKVRNIGLPSMRYDNGTYPFFLGR